MRALDSPWLWLWGMTLVLAALWPADAGSSAPNEVSVPLVRQESSSAEEREKAARDALLEAEKQAARGNYLEARRTYKTIPQRFPLTTAARIAQRRSAPSAFLGWSDIVRHGPSSNRVDVVLMGDGYELDDMKGFVRFANDVPAYFEQEKTLGEYDSYFNFLRADLVSAETGFDAYGREHDTALNGKQTQTYAEGVPVGTSIGVDLERVRAMLTEMGEHDNFALVFVKSASGGSGVSGCACLGGLEERLLTHCFGHAFADLSDENPGLSHAPGVARDGINVSTSEVLDRLPWRHWIEAKVRGVGAYQGAAGFERKVWKPTSSNCVMEGQAGEHSFCVVCQEAVVLRIYSLVDPIDSTLPGVNPKDAQAALDLRKEPIQFQVTVLRPLSHELEVSWWVLPEAVTTPNSGVTQALPPPQRFFDRRDRGPLPPIQGKPRATSSADKRGVHTFTLREADLEPGSYRVVCRARDTTVLRSERWPLVLEDDFGLLESERTWQVRR